MAQARAYDDLSTTQLGELLKQAQTDQLSHPVPVLRARSIAGQVQKIMNLCLEEIDRCVIKVKPTQRAGGEIGRRIRLKI